MLIPKHIHFIIIVHKTLFNCICLFGMKFYNCRKIESLMNNSGKERKPFLFGIDFEMEHCFFVSEPLSSSNILFENILFEINGINNYKKTISPKFDTHMDYTFDIFPASFETYEKRFNKVLNGLKRGDTFLTNLTIETPIKTSLSLKEIFNNSNSPYKLIIPNNFVCFSPESFVKIFDGKISTFPMKGTIHADTPNAESIIINDKKETAEHNTIVDLLRNDLSRVANDVKVKRFRYIEEVSTNNGKLLQVSSEIEGTLPEGYLNDIGSLIFKLLPAGSVSGAPKSATQKIISEAEMSKRGFYCGIAGYFDGNNLYSFVLIRFIEQKANGLVFRSGGGITSKSECYKEYAEALQKVYLPF